MINFLKKGAIIGKSFDPASLSKNKNGGWMMRCLK